MSRRLIESGMEFSRTMLDSNAVRGLAQSEENVAQSFYSNVNEQILRFNEAVMRTTDGMTKPIRDSISNAASARSEEHTSELQSLMRISYAVFCLKKKQH